MAKAGTNRKKKEEVPDEEPSWFFAGEDDVDRFNDEEEEARAAASNRVYRFWMPPGSDANLTFVDDLKHPGGFPLPFAYKEHNLYLDGSWKHWFTCPGHLIVEGEKVQCPICASGNLPYAAFAYTIIDHSEWKDRGGRVHKDEVKLFVAKSKVYKVLRKASKKKDGLRGWTVEVTRTDDKSPSTGDSFDFEERVELAADVQPYDYRVLLAPKTFQELSEVSGDLNIEGEDAVRF